MKALALAAFLLLAPSPCAPACHRTPRRVVAHKAVWKPCRFTTYGRGWEGRRMASGRRFHQHGWDIACRGGRLGDRIEIMYAGRKVTVTIGDRGRLPLHRRDCWQMDCPDSVAKRLGFYHPKYGRNGKWRFAREGK
jgi:hypothetical protein